MGQQIEKKGVALVTGASSGIGFHFAEQLSKMGYSLIMVSNRQEELAEKGAMIAESGGIRLLEPGTLGCTKGSRWVATLCSDLSREEAAEELFALCINAALEVELLINNAGIFIFNDMTDCTTARIDLILKLHIHTVTMLCRLFGERMAARGKGYILNMSSLAAHTPFPGISLYSATKSYIRSMTIALRLELKERGVNVLVVSPGAVATDLYSLPPELQRLGVRIKVIYRPEKLAQKALERLFRGRREFVPGFVNRFFKPLYGLLPDCAKLWLRKKTVSLKK